MSDSEIDFDSDSLSDTTIDQQNASAVPHYEHSYRATSLADPHSGRSSESLSDNDDLENYDPNDHLSSESPSSDESSLSEHEQMSDIQEHAHGAQGRTSHINATVTEEEGGDSDEDTLPDQPEGEVDNGVLSPGASTLWATAEQLGERLSAYTENEKRNLRILCPECSLPFTKSNLTTHIRRIHPLSSLIPDKDTRPNTKGLSTCPICLLDQKNLGVHVRKMHKGQPFPFKTRTQWADLPFRYQIDTDGNPVPSMQVVQWHKERRSQQTRPKPKPRDKPFKCHHCDKAFELHRSMRQHCDRDHPGLQRPLTPERKAIISKGLPPGAKYRVECPECFVSHHDADRAAEHIDRHHWDSPFSKRHPDNAITVGTTCPHCDKVYPRKDRLIEHMDRRHGDEAPPQRRRRRWYIVDRVEDDAYYLKPSLEQTPFTIKITRLRPKRRDEKRPPAEPQRSEPLRLRGGAGTDACPICSEPLPKAAPNKHFKARHIGNLADPEEFRAAGLLICICGMVYRERGFGMHLRTCPTGRVSREPITIPGEYTVPPVRTANQPYAHAPDGASSDPTETSAPVQDDEPAATDESTARTVESFDIEQWEELVSLSTTYKLLPIGLIKPFIGISSMVAKIRLDNLERAVRLFLLIPKFSLAPGLKVGNAKSFLSRHLENPVPETTPQDHNASNPFSRSERLLEQGKYGAAMRALEDETQIANATPEVTQALRLLHPTYTGTRRREQPIYRGPMPDTPDSDEIEAALDSYPRDIAPGLSGWTIDLLKLAFRDKEVKALLVELASRMQRGTFDAWELLCASRLTAFVKKGGGYRPIAVPCLIYRVLGKAMVRKLFRKDMLAPFQFGVGNEGGVEPVIHLLKAILRNEFPHDFAYLFQMDGSNAYNTLSQDAIRRGLLKFAPVLIAIFDGAYAKLKVKLVLTSTDGPVVIDATEGVRQGCPYSALFYSIGVREDLEAIANALGPEHIFVSFIDDNFAIGPHEHAHQIVEETLRSRGSSIVFNPRKCKTTSLDDIRRDGIEIMGTVIGPTEAQQAQVEDKLVAFNRSASRLLQLPSQYALLLFRMCLLPRLGHLLRTLDPIGLEESWKRVDAGVMTFVKSLLMTEGREGPDAEQIDRLLISLPMTLGGLGLLSFHDRSPHAAKASVNSSRAVLSDIIDAISAPQHQYKQRELCQAMFIEQRTGLLSRLALVEQFALFEAGSELGKAWLTLLPTTPFLRISDRDMALNLKHRLLLEPDCDWCHACGLANPSISHAESCKAAQGLRTRRHEGIKRALGRALEATPDSDVTLEPLIINRRPGDPKYNDVRFSGSIPAELRPMEFDVKVTGIGTAQYDKPARNEITAPDVYTEVGLKAAHSLKTLADATRDEQPVPLIPGATFYPFVLSSGGHSEKGTTVIFRRLQKKLPTGAYSFMIKDMGAVLAKRRAAAMAVVEGTGRFMELEDEI